MVHYLTIKFYYHILDSVECARINFVGKKVVVPIKNEKKLQTEF